MWLVDLTVEMNLRFQIPPGTLNSQILEITQSKIHLIMILECNQYCFSPLVLDFCYRLKKILIIYDYRVAILLVFINKIPFLMIYVIYSTECTSVI